MGSNKYPPLPTLTGGRPLLPGPGQPGPMGPNEFVDASIANVTNFAFDGIDPPSPLYVQRDDQLELIATTNVAVGDTVTFTMRFLRVPEIQGGQPSDGGVGRNPGTVLTRGYVQTETETIKLTAAGQTFIFKQLAEGYILSVGASNAAVLQRGRTFAEAKLFRGLTGNPLPGQILFADYCAPTGRVGWPYGRSLSPIEGPGWVHSQQIASPAAGADWSVVMTALQRVRIISLNSQLATSATVANRIPRIQIQDSAGNIVSNGAPNQVVVASQTVQVSATTAPMSSAPNVPDVLCTIPEIGYLEPGWTLKSATPNLAVGDQWSNIWLNLEEWLEV